MTPLRDVFIRISFAYQIYADDSFICFSNKTESTADIQKDFNQVVNWFTNAGLLINMEKNETELMFVNIRKKMPKRVKISRSNSS